MLLRNPGNHGRAGHQRGPDPGRYGRHHAQGPYGRQQRGVLLSSSSVTTRGTVHLRAEGDDKSRVTLARAASAPSCWPTATRLRSTCSATRWSRIPPPPARAASTGATSRWCRSPPAGTWSFDADSLALRHRRADLGRRRAAHAAGRPRRAGRGRRGGRALAMESNNVEINVQGNEQRDAPSNRDSGKLNNTTIWVDRRYLVRVPAGTNGATTDRWVHRRRPAGSRRLPEHQRPRHRRMGRRWAARCCSKAANWSRGQGLEHQCGGRLAGRADRQDQADLAAGAATAGSTTPRRAPGDMSYEGVYDGFEAAHKRWGAKATEQFYNPLIGAARAAARTATPWAAMPAGWWWPRLGACWKAISTPPSIQGPRQGQARGRRAGRLPAVRRSLRRSADS